MHSSISHTLWNAGLEDALQQPWGGDYRREMVPAWEGWGRCGLAQCLGPWRACCFSPCWILPSIAQSTGTGHLQASLSGSTRQEVALVTAESSRGLARVLWWPQLTPKMSPVSLVSQGSTRNWTTGSAGRASHAAGRGGGHRKLAHPGHPKSPGGTNLCGSRQRSLSPVTPVSGRDSSGGECSVWQIRG